MASSVDLIPADLAQSIERQTGATIIAIVPRGGGGASRMGAELTLRHGDGREERGYLSYDTRTGDPKRLPFFEREVAILKALSGPLADSGVRAPRFIAAEPAHLALLCGMVSGSDRFDQASDRMAVADALAAQLARLHAIDPASVELAGFGDPHIPPSERIATKLQRWRASHLAATPDPVLILALDWLAANIPADRGPSVILHGDAGTGNCLHDGQDITAMLDWELTHYGDPMEDLAQCWVRNLFQPFVRLSDFFKAYEAAGGIAVDVDRVRFHRLYFQMSFTAPGHANFYGESDVVPALMGISLVFHTAHMRVIVQSLGELTGQSFTGPVLPEIPASHIDRTFAIALDDLRNVITPRVADQQASAKAKSLARMVKYWRMRERYGAAFARDECAEIAAVTGQSAEDIATARQHLASALLEQQVAPETVLQLCHNRMVRETFLMADAMGSLRDCYFPSLDQAQ
ncbi:MAG: phosphotransferase family protein [Blastomonas sp.]